MLVVFIKIEISFCALILLDSSIMIIKLSSNTAILDFFTIIVLSLLHPSGNWSEAVIVYFPPVLISNFLVDALNKLGEKTDLCITSNTGITSPNVYHEFLENIGLKTTFNKIFLSNELMIAKPNIKIFKIVSSYFNLKPKNCLHIGDNLFTDVFGANNSKFKSVWLNNKNKLFDNDIKPNYTIRNITDVNKLFI